MVREGKACAGLARRDAAYAEEAVDFGCVVGGGGEVMEINKTLACLRLFLLINA